MIAISTQPVNRIPLALANKESFLDQESASLIRASAFSRFCIDVAKDKRM